MVESGSDENWELSRPAANVALDGGTEAPMNAERGWIASPQPTVEWHQSHYSRMADRIAARDREVAITDDETHD